MGASDRPASALSCPVQRRSGFAPASPGERLLPREERASEIAGVREAVARSIADLDRLAAMQETVGASEWVQARLGALHTDAWIGRVVHLIDREGLPAGEALERASAWMLSLEATPTDQAALRQVTAWLRLRLNGPAEPLPDNAVIALDDLTPDHLLPLLLLRPPAVIAGRVSIDGLRIDIPVLQRAVPANGDYVEVDLATGTVRPGRPPGALPVLQPTVIVKRWEDLAALAFGRVAAEVTGVHLDSFARCLHHPGFLHLLAHAVRNGTVAIGGKAAFDPGLLPLWCGLGAKGWFDPPEGALPGPVATTAARRVWKAVSACRTASEVRKALGTVTRDTRR